MLDECTELRLRGRNHAHGERACAARRGESPQHVRRRAARADADDRVCRAHTECEDLAFTGRTIVLGRRLDERRGSDTPRDERDDGAGGSGERRFALGRVESGDPPRRARSDVDEPTSRKHPIGNRVDRRRDLR